MHRLNVLILGPNSFVSTINELKTFLKFNSSNEKSNFKYDVILFHDDALKDKIFSSMSQRAAANIKDEMEVLGPIRLTEVQEAQKAIINVARTMSDEGSIVLAGRGGDDFV